MVNKCSAYGCTSGYKNSCTDPAITFHGYPLNDQELCNKWVRANPRHDFKPTKHSRICSLHFHASDFITTRRDSNKRRMKVYADDKLSRRYLKAGVIPSIFPNAPAHLSKAVCTLRTTESATASSRREKESQFLEDLHQSMIEEDNVFSLTSQQLADRILSEPAIPSGYTVTVFENKVLAYIMSFVDSYPTVQACITVTSDKSVTVAVNRKTVPTSRYKDILNGQLKTLSQFVNIMARTKALLDDYNEKTPSLLIDLAVECLKSCLSSKEDDDSAECRSLSFFLEQLQLMRKNKKARHYSPELTILSYMTYAASPSAYSVLRDEQVLCLPSVSTLNKVARRVGMNGSQGLDNSEYLQLRVSKLEQFQRHAVLMIDEIYIAKRIEYSAGKVKGLTTDGKVATTLLCFMVKSVAGPYRDVVGIFPVCKLTAGKLHECYEETMRLLRGTPLNIVAISVDNAATNRKFFKDYLCSGQLQTHINDPVTGQPIHLIFDPVHNLKNIYNNFQKRKLFSCPPFPLNLPNGCTANFQHIVELHQLEGTMSLKKAHRLTPSVLEPKSIEKTSVRLAAALFNESTRDALKYYASNEGKADWTGTADFVSLIIKVWNVLNVKSRSKGKHKRDITMDPVRSSLDWKLDFLTEFSEFLVHWENSGAAGLSKETFLALRQTCRAIVECSRHLLDRCGVHYILLGSLQSDSIERRFGWWRQLSGANYYISAHQVMESDRKIKTLSLVKYSRITLNEIDGIVQSRTSPQPSNLSDEAIADNIVSSLKLHYSPTESDNNIIYYVSGYIARSIVRTTNCDDCRNCLVTDENVEPLPFGSDSIESSTCTASSTFFDAVNRGGLLRPTDFTFSVVVFCWCVFEEIRESGDHLNKFLCASHQQDLFTKIIERARYNVQTGELQPMIDSLLCIKGHDLNQMISERVFNCLAKNLVKDITNKADSRDLREAKKRRKISKLTSSVCLSQH